MSIGNEIIFKSFQPYEWVFYDKWFKDESNQEVFQSIPKDIDPIYFQRFPELLEAEVYTIYNAKPIGFVGIQQLKETPKIYNLIVMVDSEHKKSGIGTEVANSFSTQLLENKLADKVTIQFSEDNEEIKRYADENGWKFEARLIKENFVNEKYLDELRYYKMRDL